MKYFSVDMMAYGHDLFVETAGFCFFPPGLKLDNMGVELLASNESTMNEVYREYFPENFPARDCVIVGLVKEEFLVEIGAIAVTG